jgi:hypothetical protein
MLEWLGLMEREGRNVKVGGDWQECRRGGSLVGW